MLEGDIRVVTRLAAEVAIGGVGIVADRQPIYVDSDNIVSVGPVTDRLGSLTTAQIKAATGTVTLFDADGDAVSGATNIALTIFTGSNNRFYAAIENTVGIVDAANYSVKVTLTAGGVTLVIKELLVGAFQT